MKISVAARASPLSRAQVAEVQQEIGNSIVFEPVYVETTGDLDQKTSLRTLPKNDFFTKEVDELLLSRKCRIAVHSAKDLPETLPAGLKMIALTRGRDPSDSLVIRENETLHTMPQKALIATSSERREEAARLLRSDFTFCDVRGTIANRLKLLAAHQADGVIVAEAALLRLGLSHLNRIRLPGETAPYQGQLAILAREEDAEMAKLFYPLDSRTMPQALYVGPDYPLKLDQKCRLTHTPLLDIAVREICPALEAWPQITHLIFTSKNGVKGLIHLLRQKNIPVSTLKDKTAYVVGSATAEALAAYGVDKIHVADVETAEGVCDLIKKMPIKKGLVFWPHSSQSRSVISDYLKSSGTPFMDFPIYDPVTIAEAELPDLNTFDKVIFSSPSTVEAFFAKNPLLPKHLSLIAIGPVTAAALAKKRPFYENEFKAQIATS